MKLGVFDLPGVYAGDCRVLLRQLPDNSIHSTITSPPYWGLRKYEGEQDVVWGGDDKCQHVWGNEGVPHHPGQVEQTKWKDADAAGRGQTAGSGWFCQKCHAWKGSLGLEPTVESYVEHLVEVFREVKRVLRDDGTVWLNLGDCYSNDPRGGIRLPGCGSIVKNSARYQGGGKLQIHGKMVVQPMLVTCPTCLVDTLAEECCGNDLRQTTVTPSLKPGDLMMIPHRLAIALQADGWWIRSGVVWVKGLSFCPAYAGSVMPESVQGVRWERHRIKTERAKVTIGQANLQDGHVDGTPKGSLIAGGGNPDRQAKWVDCPGCEKCKANGGYVLRRGSGRPTNSYEMVFLLAKSQKYYYDTDAVRESALRAGDIPGGSKKTVQLGDRPNPAYHATRPVESGRNLRSAWAINPSPYRGGHYASFPPALVAPCVKASTSEKGVCPTCGAPWARVVERTDRVNSREPERTPRGETKTDSTGWEDTYRPTNNWLPTCSCPKADPVPAVVLDPFAGAGTTPTVATALGRLGLGFDISEEYVEKHARPYLSKWREVAKNINAGRSGPKKVVVEDADQQMSLLKE